MADFRLQGVQRLREQQRADAQAGFVEAQRRLEDARRGAEEAQARLSERSASLSSVHNGGELSGAELRRRGGYAQRLLAERRALARELAAAQDRLHAARQTLEHCRARLAETEAQRAALQRARDAFDAEQRRVREQQDEAEVEEALLGRPQGRRS